MSREEWGFILLIVALVAAIAVQFIQPINFKEVVYDCRVAEISPDVPAKVKEACRKRMEKR